MRRAPENTLASIEQAAREGAGWVEFDVKLSADGVPVLMHDRSLRRTTGLRAMVRHTDFLTIRSLDAGLRFDPDFVGEPVPTLREALQLCASLGLTPNIEIKPCPGRERLTALAVTEAIKAHWPKAEAPPLLSSFSVAALITARRDAPAYPRGLLARRLPADWRQLQQRLELSAIHLNGLRITTSDLADCREAGLPVIAWTINSPRVAASLLAAGISTIITDCPAELRQRLALLPPSLQRLRSAWLSESGDDEALLPLMENLLPANDGGPAIQRRFYGRLTRYALNRWA
jgi:glycerophosphoryl diester phosphodiesterase